MTSPGSYRREAYRRQAVQLPSRRKHVLLAVLVCLGVLLLPVLAVAMFGNEDDAIAQGMVDIIPLPEADNTPELANINLETPDLLAGEVPDGANPTEEIAAKLDALGNPVGAPAAATPSQAAAKPKVIKIDGQIIGGAPLPAAPLPGLTQPSLFGVIPAKSANGGTALTRYNRPFRSAAGKRPVSLIIGGLGINRALTQQAIDELPADVTLSFAAHATGLQSWIDQARADGHEVMIEIPMESDGFNPSEPGANRALRLTLGVSENRRNLDWSLSRAQGYWGVTNYNGEAFLKRADVTAPILDRLSQTGVGFITDGAFATPSLPALSRSVKLPFKSGFGLIDPDPIPAIINTRLSELAASAQSGAHPVGVGFAYPETIQTVRGWVSGLDAQGLVLAPASATLQP